MSETTLERVTRIVSEHLGLPVAEVKPESSFVADLGADSLDTIELVMILEDDFGLGISDAEAEQIVTVAQAVAWIDAHQPA